MLKVLFPISVLRHGALLIDPANLDLTGEYHLLENLAVGLVRDDMKDPRGYRPALARDWSQLNEKTWIFFLRDNLKWSDGQPITGSQLVDHFNALKQKPSRHLRQLTNLQNISFDAPKRSLTLSFSKPVNDSLLHELSLADAVLTRPENLTIGWNVTSGPYYVADMDLKNYRIHLKANPFCPLLSKSSPQEIELFWPTDKADLDRAFKDIPVDLFVRVPFHFRKRLKAIEAQAGQVFKGVPNLLYFFRFNGKHPLASNLDARRVFASVVAAAFEGWNLDDGIIYDRQFIPTGFAGRLSSTDDIAKSYSSNVLDGHKIEISLHPAFQEVPEFGERLVSAAKSLNVTITISYKTSLNLKDDKEEFAVFETFMGNQKDALGSWSFLFSPHLGPLSHFEPKAHEFLEGIISARSEASRQEALKDLHREVLSQVFAVPFMYETGAILASSQVNLAGLNAFDLRPRFYDIAWKN